MRPILAEAGQGTNAQPPNHKQYKAHRLYVADVAKPQVLCL
jgi:hypothetical protein